MTRTLTFQRAGGASSQPRSPAADSSEWVGLAKPLNWSAIGQRVGTLQVPGWPGTQPTPLMRLLTQSVSLETSSQSDRRMKAQMVRTWTERERETMNKIRCENARSQRRRQDAGCECWVLEICRSQCTVNAAVSVTNDRTARDSANLGLLEQCDVSGLERASRGCSAGSSFYFGPRIAGGVCLGKDHRSWNLQPVLRTKNKISASSA